MADIVTDATPKTAGYASRGSNYSAKQARIEKEEKEIEELMKAQGGAPVEEETVESEEAPVEAEEVETKEEAEADAVEDEKLSGEEKSFKKRYGDLRRHMSTKEKEWEARFAALESNTSSTVRPPKSDEDIEDWARQYPDVAAIVESIAEKKATEKFASAEGRLREFDEAKEEAERTKAETVIRKAHSDFDDLRAGDDFHNWVEEQPKWISDAVYENSDDPRSVIRVLDLYKVDKGMTPSDKKAQAKDAAKTVSKRTRTKVDATGSESMIKESVVAKMSDAQFEANYDAISEAMQSGKFVYDISGKAR
jgi:DNA repair exonuclease SbcCD ATPase subunit